MDNEDLGRMVHTIWSEHSGETWPSWERLPPKNREIFVAIGKELYTAGFQTGADSVGMTHE